MVERLYKKWASPLQEGRANRKPPANPCRAAVRKRQEDEKNKKRPVLLIYAHVYFKNISQVFDICIPANVLDP
jgi:hypothetical protein